MCKIFILSLILGSSVSALTTSLEFEAMMLQEGGSKYKKFAYTGPWNGTQPTAYNSSHLCHKLGYQPVFRGTLGFEQGGDGALIRALGSRGWSCSKSLYSPITHLSYPFNNPLYAQGYYLADAVKITYKTNFYMADAYYTHDVTPLWKNYFGLRGLIGLQYLYLPQKIALKFQRLDINQQVDQENTYRGRVYNNFGLLGMGFQFQVRPVSCFAADFFVIGGIGGVGIRSKTRLGVLNNTVIQRSSDASKGRSAYTFIGEVRAVYKPGKNFELGAGYEFFYINGLNYPYQQMSDKTKGNSDQKMGSRADTYFQGASVRFAFLF